MASTHFVGQIPGGNGGAFGLGTLTLKMYTRKTNTLLNSAPADTAAEDGTRPGFYDWTVTHAVVGVVDCLITNGAGEFIAHLYSEAATIDDTGTYEMTSVPRVVMDDSPNHGGTSAIHTFAEMVGVATTTDADCISLTGNGTGVGLSTNGGATGDGLSISGGSSAGVGMTIAGTGTGTKAGIVVTCATNGIGLQISGGPSTGDGVHISSTANRALRLLGGGGNVGLQIKGGATADAIALVGGATSGDCISLKTTSGVGIEASTVTGGVMWELLVDNILDELITGHITADSVGAALTSLLARLPTLLVNGRIDANTSAVDDSNPAAVNLKQSSLALVVAAVAVAAGSANTATIFDTNLSQQNDDYYGDANGGLVIAFVSSATNAFQTARIIASTDSGANTRITLEKAMDAIPPDGSGTDPADDFIALGRITELK